MDICANEDALSCITEVSATSYQTSMTLRNARISIPDKRTTDVQSKQILGEVEEAIRNKEDANQKDKTMALSLVTKVFSNAMQALDLAYLAGALASKAQGYAQADSLKYAASPASQDSNWKNTSAEPEKHWN